MIDSSYFYGYLRIAVFKQHNQCITIYFNSVWFQFINKDVWLQYAKDCLVDMDRGNIV